MGCIAKYINWKKKYCQKFRGTLLVESWFGKDL